MKYCPFEIVLHFSVKWRVSIVIIGRTINGIQTRWQHVLTVIIVELPQVGLGNFRPASSDRQISIVKVWPIPQRVSVWNNDLLRWEHLEPMGAPGLSLIGQHFSANVESVNTRTIIYGCVM